MNKLLGFDKVLCLSPHPDDVEYGMLGTVLTYPGTRFIILTMSYGTAGDVTSGLVRQEEVTLCWEGINNVNVKFTGVNALEDMKEREWINFLEREHKRQLDACNAIFIPPDYDTHYEHMLVNRIGSALTRSRTVGLLEYRTASTLDLWTSNMKVDITDVYSQKLRMINAFKSQARHGYFLVPALQAFHMDYDARKRGTHMWREEFRIVRLWVGGNGNVQQA